MTSYFIKHNFTFSYFKTVNVSNEIHEPYSDPLRSGSFSNFLESSQQSENFNTFEVYKELFMEIKMFSISAVVSE
jgi:hypothetical protein